MSVCLSVSGMLTIWADNVTKLGSRLDSDTGTIFCSRPMHSASWNLSPYTHCLLTFVRTYQLPWEYNTSFCYCCLVWEKFYEPETYKDISAARCLKNILLVYPWFQSNMKCPDRWIRMTKQASIFIGPNHSIQSIDNNVWTCWEIARTYYYSIQLLFFSYGRSWSFLSVANFKLLLIYKRYCLSAVLSMLSCVIVSKWLMPLLLPFTIGYSYCSLLLRDSCISAAYAVVRCPSVRLSVLCPSRSCIVSKRVNVFSNFSPTVEFYL